MPDKLLSELTEEDYETARKAVEDKLIEMRDARISILSRNNGLVVKEADGKDSHVIRFGFETGMKYAVNALLKPQKGTE